MLGGVDKYAWIHGQTLEREDRQTYIHTYIHTYKITLFYLICRFFRLSWHKSGDNRSENVLGRDFETDSFQLFVGERKNLGDQRKNIHRSEKDKDSNIELLR